MTPDETPPATVEKIKVPERVRLSEELRSIAVNLEECVVVDERTAAALRSYGFTRKWKFRTQKREDGLIRVWRTV